MIKFSFKETAYRSTFDVVLEISREHGLDVLWGCREDKI
jgi:hypothetical protein